jgi:CRP/FNR family transcriptional regulator, cyclic AMP receptor protein
VRVLEADPDLAIDLDEEQTRAAREELVAPVIEVEWKQQSGRWGPSEDHNLLGLLVVDGVLLRETRLLGTFSAELLGHGDLLAPWDVDGGYTLPPTTEVCWTRLAPIRLAVLSPDFVRRACRWPTILTRLAGRSMRRARTLALQDAITNLKHVETRLLAQFSHLAERFGRVGPGGIGIRLPLTHEMLAKLVGATRPSVTTALGSLADRGVLTRDEGGVWLLDGQRAPHSAFLVAGDRAIEGVLPGPQVGADP